MIVSISSPNGSQDMVEFSHIIWRQSYTVLYFYPKDNTSGCTLEAQEFDALRTWFADRGVQIIGVSKDSHKSHCSFIEKHWLWIPLISDPEWLLHKQFGAVGEKSMYGKKYIGTIRSTFLLDSSWNVVYHWPNVQARWHAQEVLDYITTHLS
jgi:peroxiredoxin Q/BCP